MFYLGIDVAKAKIDCCLILENSANKKKTKTFSNTPKGFEQLQIWLNQHAATSTQTIILMEATSIYHELLAKYLFDEGYQVSVTNPARARYFAQSMSKLNKTDKVDSEVLARFAMTANLHFWQPLPKHIQLLNALLDRSVNGNLKLTPFTLKQQSKIDPFDDLLRLNLWLNSYSLFIF